MGATILGLVILFCTCNWILKPYGRHLEDVYPSLRGLGLVGGRMEEDDDDDDEYYFDDLVRARIMSTTAANNNETYPLNGAGTPVPVRSPLYRSHRRSIHARSIRARSRSPAAPTMSAAAAGRENTERGNTTINFQIDRNRQILPSWRHFYPQPSPNDRPFCSPPPTYGSCQQQQFSSSIVNNNINEQRYHNYQQDFEEEFHRTRSAASTPPPSYESCNFESLPINVPYPSLHQHHYHHHHESRFGSMNYYRR